NPEVMNRLPRDRGQSLTDRSFLDTMLVAAAPVAAVSFLVFLYGLQTGGLALGRSYAFTSMVFSQLLVAVSARNGMTPLWRRNPLSNPYLVVVVAGLILIQMASHQNASFAHILQTAELSLQEQIWLLAASAAPMLLLELVKSMQHRVATKESGAAAVGRPWMNWITAGVIAAAAAGAWLQWPAKQGAPARFVTGVIERGSRSRTIEGSGASIEGHETKVFSLVAGVVRFHDCEVGSTVAENQLCATIEHGPSRAAVARLRAAVAKTRIIAARDEIRQARARTTLDRARASGVRRNTLIAERAYEMANDALRHVKALAAQYEADLSGAERDLARTEVRAPVAGLVSERAAQGATAKKDGPPLFVVSNEEGSRIEIAVAPGDVQAIEVGDRAFVEVAGETLPAHVETVRKMQSRVLIGVDAPERRLAPGVSANARIEVESREGLLFAPNEAVLYAQDKCRRPRVDRCASQLWVLRDGRPVAVSVELGSSDGERTEIIGGDLKAGDILILGERD
ncbi:MAG TPA: cation transporting ATPase C-terminal domain-containing protein, partial [Xanthobacteraceae bacterium]